MKRIFSILPEVVLALLLVCAINAAGAAGPTDAEVMAALNSATETSHVETHGAYLPIAGVGIGLLLFVAWTAYRRHHETEARALTGGYISDGVEAAWLKFPELLTMGADVRSPKAVALLASMAGTESEEFYRWAEKNIAAMRKLLPSFGTVHDSTARKQLLTDLAGTLEAFKSKTAKPELRPAWQLAFVLDLLVNRLRERPSEVTLSTARTIAGGLDVLSAACVAGIRSDLIVEPPIAVLAVDDDPLCLRAIAFALQKAGLTPDTAVDGVSAVSKCAEKAYDVVFMDIMMPHMDGLEACQRLRSDARNANTPVVFVTARSDFQTRERSAEVGGAELIGKPFLVTELTVKAVSFCMRKRLNLPMTGGSSVVLENVPPLSPSPAAGTANPAPSPVAVTPDTVAGTV